VVRVRSTAQMAEAVWTAFPACDVLVMAAAPADFTPARPGLEKVRKQEAPLVLELAPTPDVLASLPGRRPHQVVVGFAAESANPVENALAKCLRKRLDLIVANDISRSDAGFASPFNQVWLVAPGQPPVELPRLLKTEVAVRLWDAIAPLLAARPVPAEA
jgi:phosphopantothenoylcysteine decarboxylase/phosphopantothenate--cysteine ligase